MSQDDKSVWRMLDETFGGISTVLYVASADGDFMPEWVGGNIARTLGILPASCAGCAGFWRERIHPEDADRALRGMAEAVETGEGVHEFRLRSDAGHYLWVRNEVSRKQGSAGDYLAGCLRDISSEKECLAEFNRHEEIQRAREHFYRSVLDSLPQRLFWKDRNSVFRGCNHNGAAALGLGEPDEIVGKSDYDFYHDRQKADYLRLLDEQVMNEGLPRLHAEIVAGDGESWLDVSKIPLCDQSGAVYGLLVSYEDVSALRKSEMALNKFKRAVEHSYNSVFITDREGNIEYVNPEFLATYGYEEREVIGQTPRLLKSGLMSAEIYRDLWDTILSGRHWRNELSNRKKNGEITWQSVSISPIFDEAGAITHFLSIEDDITAHKMLEGELKRELKFNQKMIDALPHPVYYKDMSGRYRRVNRAFEENFGLVAGEGIGKTAFDIFPEEIAAILIASDDRVMRRGGVDALEFRLDEGSGKPVYLLSHKTSFVGEDGKMDGILGSYFDITESKRVEAALAENEARLRELTSTVGEGLFVVNAEHEITFANPAATELLGWDEAELLGLHDDFFIVGRTEGTGGANENIVHSVGSQLCTLRSEDESFVRQDGTIFPVSVIASPIMRDGVYAGAVVAFHDITEQRFTRDLLNNALQELRTVLDNAQIGVAYLRDGRFTWINRHMEEMFGYSIDELRQWSTGILYEQDGSPGESGGGPLSMLPGGKAYEGEHRMRRRSGEAFWCRLRGVPVEPSRPESGSIWILLDIDRQKNTENRMKALNESLAQQVEEETRRSLEKERLLIHQGRSAAMGEMIGNIAHQWRQPLSTLGLVVQNIQADYLDDSLDREGLDKYVETAMRAVQRMSSTIDDFRDFFRPNRNSERFSIRQSAMEAIQLLDAMLKNNGIAIELNGDPLLTVFGHANEFSQVILNLVANAKDALVERRTQGGRIEILVESNGGVGVLRVRDNAGGIDEGLAEKIFDPYFTTKTSGTGIGLYMCKIIVEHHMGGSIAFRNLFDGDRRTGAEFAVKIPLLGGNGIHPEEEK